MASIICFPLTSRETVSWYKPCPFNLLRINPRRCAPGHLGTRETIEGAGLRDYADLVIASVRHELDPPKPAVTPTHEAVVARVWVRVRDGKIEEGWNSFDFDALPTGLACDCANGRARSVKAARAIEQPFAVTARRSVNAPTAPPQSP